MNRKIGLMAVLFLALAILIESYGYEEYAEEQLKLATLDMPVSELGEIGELWITVPATENRGLTCDVNGVTFEGDNSIYIIISEDVDRSEVVYYVRDEFDNYVTRMESDFNEPVFIAGKQIQLIETQLPVLFFETEEYRNFREELLKAENKETLCYGDVYLSVNESTARKNGWVTELVSQEADTSSPHTAFLRPRGNGTWAGPNKKPFSLYLERASDLLGMGKNKKWNLLANSQDKTLLKNYVFNQLAQNLGMEFVPKMQSVLLYVNGSYQGVYLLTTKVSVDKKRINLGKNDFLVNWGAPNPEQRINYESTSWFIDGDIQEPYVELEYPKNDSDLDSKQEIIQRFISAIEDVNSSDYLNYMDMDSMVKYYWIQEASMNYDASFRSAYSYYRRSTDKIYMGPIWDMDLTLGVNALKQGISFETPEDWKIRKLGWYVPLFEHPEFAEAVRQAYFEGGVRDELLNSLELFESEKQRLSVDGEADFCFWKEEMEQWAFHYDVDTYEEEVDDVIDFYRRRLEWIDQEMQKESYH